MLLIFFQKSLEIKARKIRKKLLLNSLAHFLADFIARTLAHLQEVLKVVDFDLIAIETHIGYLFGLGVVHDHELAILSFFLLINQIEHRYVSHEAACGRYQVVF